MIRETLAYKKLLIYKEWFKESTSEDDRLRSVSNSRLVHHIENLSSFS